MPPQPQECIHGQQGSVPAVVTPPHWLWLGLLTLRLCSCSLGRAHRTTATNVATRLVRTGPESRSETAPDAYRIHKDGPAQNLAARADRTAAARDGSDRGREPAGQAEDRCAQAARALQHQEQAGRRSCRAVDGELERDPGGLVSRCRLVTGRARAPQNHTCMAERILVMCRAHH